MTIDVAHALGDLTRQLNENGRRIDNLYAALHAENAGNIDDNEDGIVELGESESDNSDAILELAEMISELQAEVTELKKALNGGV